MQTLCVLLDKGGSSLKAFVPQLQTTFVKSLNDPSKATRHKAGVGLGKLMSLSPRVDPVVSELFNMCGTASKAISASVLEALAVVLAQGGERVTVWDKVASAVLSQLTDGDESTHAPAVKCCVFAGLYMDEGMVLDVLAKLVDGSAGSGERWQTIAGRGKLNA
jgi:hypothetical protein